MTTSTLDSRNSPRNSLRRIQQQTLAKVVELEAEKQRRAANRLRNIDVFKVLGYEPTCKPRTAARAAGVPESDLPPPCGGCPQELFHAATEDDLLFGGSAGGGKTKAIVMEGVRACIRHPGLRVLILRRTYDELAESIYPEFEQIGWAAAVGGSWNKTEKQITFTNGSVIRLRYMENLGDASKRQGGAYQLLLVDERTLMPPGVIDAISFERLRSAHGLPVLGVRSTCNPGGPSHSEVKARYIEATNHGRRTVTDKGITRRFIPAKATDNPHLDAGYLVKLDAIPDPKRRAAMRDGDWEQFAGMVFGEWRRARHVVEPFTLPPEWARYSGIDYGYVAPFAVTWGALDNDRRLWVYRDLARSQVTEADQAAMILDAQGAGENVAIYAADPSMWAKHGGGDSPAIVYLKNGVPITPANNDRILGWHAIHSLLAEGPACVLHRQLDWDTCPMMHVFSTCEEVLRTLPGLPHATKGNPEDADTSADDHIPDSLRYLAMAIGAGPQFPEHDVPEETEQISDYVTPLRPLGAFAVRDPDHLEADWYTETPTVNRVATTGTAPWHQ